MERATSSGHGEDPAVSGDLLVPAGLWRPDGSAQAVSTPATNQTQVQSAYSKYHKISRQLHDLEPAELIRSKTVVPSDDAHKTDAKVWSQVHLLATDRLSPHTHLQPVAQDRGWGVWC
jgi:hypothetical protein